MNTANSAAQPNTQGIGRPATQGVNSIPYAYSQLRVPNVRVSKSHLIGEGDQLHRPVQDYDFPRGIKTFQDPEKQTKPPEELFQPIRKKFKPSKSNAYHWKTPYQKMQKKNNPLLSRMTPQKNLRLARQFIHKPNSTVKAVGYGYDEIVARKAKLTLNGQKARPDANAQ